MRSEFDDAEKVSNATLSSRVLTRSKSFAQHLADLIAHTRTYGIFPYFSARITLHNAHLSHALNRQVRALQCYNVAAKLAEEGTMVNLSARAGRILLLIGMGDDAPEEEEVDDAEIHHVVKTCQGMGGTLQAIGHILEASLSTEIMKSKYVMSFPCPFSRRCLPLPSCAPLFRQHLKSALNLATQSQDNHLRALVLALISAQYFYTAGDHAQQMLQTCEQLAAGLGAPPSKTPGSSAENAVVFGNVPMGLWVGERFLGTYFCAYGLSALFSSAEWLRCVTDLYKRAGKTARAEKQAATNAHYAEALDKLKMRGAPAVVIP